MRPPTKSAIRHLAQYHYRPNVIGPSVIVARTAYITMLEKKVADDPESFESIIQGHNHMHAELARTDFNGECNEYHVHDYPWDLQ